jgi:hypothetical protein
MRLVVCVFFMLISCTSQDGENKVAKSKTAITESQSSVDKVHQTTVNGQTYKESSCDSLLKWLIVSSNFDKTGLLSDCMVSVDSYDQKVYLLKVSVFNSELKNESAIGWIEMDVKRSQLRDVTIDPERPKYLQFDSVLFNQLASFCLTEK